MGIFNLGGTNSSSKNAPYGVRTNDAARAKNGLASFSFGSNSSFSEKASKPCLSTSPTSKSIMMDSDLQESKSLQSSQESQLQTPVNSPIMEDVMDTRSSIFERSVQDCSNIDIPGKSNHPKCMKCCANRSRSCTHNSSISLQGGQYLRNEDCIPAALDATTLILHDKDTNLDNVEMIYSNRRNSSVIGLNMALGRSVTPSRKGSVYSLHSTTFSNAPSFNQSQQVQSPVSPPKLATSKSSLSFYSYADMISNGDKRPSFKPSYSQSFVPTLASSKKRPNSGFQSNRSQSLLSKQLPISESPQNSPGQSFMISPESSDSEEIETYLPLQEKRKSTSSSFTSSSKNSRSINFENESLISSSVGDCIRQSTIEINGQ